MLLQQYVMSINLIWTVVQSLYGLVSQITTLLHAHSDIKAIYHCVHHDFHWLIYSWESIVYRLIYVIVTRSCPMPLESG